MDTVCFWFFCWRKGMEMKWYVPTFCPLSGKPGLTDTKWVCGRGVAWGRGARGVEIAPRVILLLCSKPTLRSSGPQTACLLFPGSEPSMVDAAFRFRCPGGNYQNMWGLRSAPTLLRFDFLVEHISAFFCFNNMGRSSINEPALPHGWGWDESLVYILIHKRKPTHRTVDQGPCFCHLCYSDR